MTSDQRSKLCEELLPWARGVVRRELGGEAVEFAGLGLLEAIDSYDPDAGSSLKSWAYRTLYRVAVREFRKLHGRRGSRKYQARGTTCTINDRDDAAACGSPSDRAVMADNVIEALKHVDSCAPIKRRALLLRALGGFSRDTQSRILGIPRKRLGRAIA